MSYGQEETISYGGEEELLISSKVSGQEEEICRLSHPSHPHTLSRRYGEHPPSGCFASSDSTFIRHSLYFYFFCTTCDLEFDQYCYLRPRKMTHPYHPQHPLIFSVQDRQTGIIHDSDIHSYDVSSIIPEDSSILGNCNWCGNDLRSFDFFYRCSICNFSLDSSCSQSFPLPTISNPKSHHHSLIFLPRPLLFPCDACGLVEQWRPSYACFQCNYVVHKDCIDLPRVIKITRHPHRLFYTPFLSPSTSSLCRLCYETVDINYGQYTCNHDDCSFVVHSKCATHKNVWDGRELEWEPEEFDETEDVAPFKKVGDDLIKYFCHDHHLKLEKYDRVRDMDKQCQACVLHVDSRHFYNCFQCDYVLHEVCANLPRKLDHGLHNHPLFLDPVPLNAWDSSNCSVCERVTVGFVYKCSKKRCTRIYQQKRFQVDVRCILVPDCFTHKSHEHPLFLPIHNYDTRLCNGCNHTGSTSSYYLQCTLCKVFLCYECATIPDKLHNKYDAVPFSLCYGEVSDQTYWCEVCEGILDPREWFYTCSKPYITIHRSCVFGWSAYMMPGYTLLFGNLSIKVICNSSNTRLMCHNCDNRCSSTVYLKLSNGIAICSYQCLRDFNSKLDRSPRARYNVELVNWYLAALAD
ncbi:Cysteine/Histidine-rich C1 domain family protein [Arabidopsis thaliana]|uniref:Cysteine/Histidine-rich C1 domain family protein n=2 Tax=Arabidopsis thaliana TaxID=3702 RepID=Q84X54_ARATH|nr:Cysteine/Histidine-rich C1 domain family protein [Arabidopsis thaliana]AAO37133.1 hypothetical protein [Arabidopsis thaliana]ABE65450.1 DC1 domain-containing protein [Arabidopsis thaliana]AEC06656.1 Cysteine/Histidine-rich C1 domain family protein [Arabidopsis thaliana]|eukprot:NP_179350.2 Cysteine/Histidine-rich C1 domain family protein [Arabidopsis thaliana]